MHRLSAVTLSQADAAGVADRVLRQRVQAIHKHLSPDAALRVGLFVRKPPSFQSGKALSLNWSPRFADKEAPAAIWRDLLLPALARVADALHQFAPGREIEAFGLPTLPASAALGCALLSTGPTRASWRQVSTGHPDQIWSLTQAREPSGFQARIASKNASARDIAILVSVADDTEPVFAVCQKDLPPLRALVQVAKDRNYPHHIGSAGIAADIAHVVQEGLRAARREYGDVGTIHLFMAVPAGLAMLIGQLLNTFGAVQTYEHVTIDGSGRYRAAALLKPNH